MLGQFVDDVVHLGLGPHVNAARRLIEDEQAGLGVEPFAEDHFLLVAAREGSSCLLHAGGADVEALAERFGRFFLFLALHQTKPVGVAA